jgi:hypothetical protein
VGDPAEIKLMGATWQAARAVGDTIATRCGYASIRAVIRPGRAWHDGLAVALMGDIVHGWIGHYRPCDAVWCGYRRTDVGAGELVDAPDPMRARSGWLHAGDQGTLR